MGTCVNEKTSHDVSMTTVSVPRLLQRRRRGRRSGVGGGANSARGQASARACMKNKVISFHTPTHQKTHQQSTRRTQASVLTGIISSSEGSSSNLPSASAERGLLVTTKARLSVAEGLRLREAERTLSSPDSGLGGEGVRPSGYRRFIPAGGGGKYFLGLVRADLKRSD